MSETKPNGAAPANETGAGELEALRRQLQTETQLRTAAESRVTTAERERHETQQRLVTTTDQQLAAYEQAVTNGMAAAESDASKAEAEIAAANSEGRFADAAKAHRALANAEARILGFQTQKAQVEGYKTQWTEQQKQQREAPVQQADPLAGLTPGERDWVKAHPQFLNDAGYQQKVGAIHNYITQIRGIQRDTPAYYEALETELGERRARQTAPEPAEDEDDGFTELEVGETPEPEAEPEPEPAVKPAPRRAPMSSAAPVSRSVPSQAGGRQRETVKLSQREMEAAKISFPDEYKKNPNDAYTAYARNKVALEAQGKLTRH